jgi:hypothetical protein
MTVNHTFLSPTLAAEPDNGREPLAQTNATNKMTKQHETDLACTHSQSLLENDRFRRARYAANQRYSSSHNSRQDSFHNDRDGEASTSAHKSRLHHHKNNLTARMYHLRQRREARRAQEEVRCLEEANEELNAQIQGLQGEIDELQASAPNHQRCDCQIVRYDCYCAETVDTSFRCIS